MKCFFASLLLLSLPNYLFAQDTIRFQLCAELWKDSRPIKGATLALQATNGPGFTFVLDTSQHCAEVTLVTGNYPSDTRFSYNAWLPDTGYLNGVNSIDLCRISQHIVGIEPLPSPYAMIAADANKSGSITTFDVVELKKLILGVYSELPNNTAWRFLPDYYHFINPNNPFQFCLPPFPCPTDISMSELVALDGDTAKVISIKVGDVDGDVRLLGEPVSTDSITLLLPEGLIIANVPIAVPVKLEQDYNLGSLQVNFLLDPNLLEYDTTSDGALDIYPPSFAHYNPLTGKLSCVSIAHDQFVPAGTPLFYIHLKALQNVDLKDVLKVMTDNPDIKSFVTEASCGPAFEIVVAYSGTVPAHVPEGNGLRVLAPSPNPFREQTFLAIELDNAETAFLEVFDLAGGTLFSESKNLSAGISQWEIPASAVPSGGLAIWRLRVAGQMAAGKLAKK